MRVLLIDLNNFSRYPTLSVGYVAAVLRRRGVTVDVLSPFSFGIHGFPRRVRERRWQKYTKFLGHWTAVTRVGAVRRLRQRVKDAIQPGGHGDRKAIVDAVKGFLDRRPDVVLISAYTMYYEVCCEIGRICHERRIPVVVGGNSFVVESIGRRWSEQPGITAVYGGEPEPYLYEMVEKVSRGEDITSIPGVYSPNTAWVAEPLENLDQVPFPDFADFPWQSYPHRIVPVMAGRGCGWGKCDFCSDVLMSAARTFRSRSLANVLEEVRVQRERYDVDLFVFLDLKLNSDLGVWRGLAERLPEVAPGIKWTASVHVDSRLDHGLTAHDLERAAHAGLVRMTTGLESGSQRVLNAMAKGVKLHRMSEFVRATHAAGISLRLTTIIGHPGEESEDIDLTRKFIEEHSVYIERVTLNRFTYMPNTPIGRKLNGNTRKYPRLKVYDLDPDSATIPHDNPKLAEARNLAAVYRLIDVVNQVNCKPLIQSAMEFEGAF